MELKYFDKIPKISYDINKDGNGITITNIFTRVNLLKNILNNDIITYQYYIREGDTIETIAYDYYGDPYYHWVIMLTNSITDIFASWPLDYEKYKLYLNKKYSDDDLNSNGEQRANQMVHHYEDFDGYTIHRDTYIEYLEKPGSSPPKKISALAYETAMNDKKRYIKILNKDYLKQFINNFDHEIGFENNP